MQIFSFFAECDEAEQNISIILNGIESELKFCINKEENKVSETKMGKENSIM